MGRESGRLSNSGCSDSVRDWMQTHVALSADLLVAVVRLGEESERRLNDTTTESTIGEKASSAAYSLYASSCCPSSSVATRGRTMAANTVHLERVEILRFRRPTDFVAVSGKRA